ncbi:MAG: CHASE domain-containing protein [Colwellia sp.]
MLVWEQYYSWFLYNAMSISLQKFVFATLLYFVVCVSAMLVVTPFSFINFIGPAAGVSSGLIILWGVDVLLAVLFGTGLFSLLLVYYFGVNINLAMIMIALLAIVLQSFWSRKITLTAVRKQAWLKSRKSLLFFLLKLGPLSGVISASTALVIAIIDNKVIGGSFIYTFISSWSSTMLVAIFVTPLLLFTQGTQKLSLSKRVFISVSTILGAIAIGLLFRTSQDVQQHQRLDDFTTIKMTITRLLSREINLISQPLNSLTALFKTQKKVSLDDFTTFSENIFEVDSSIRTLEWSPIIAVDDIRRFEQQASEQLNINYQINAKHGDIIVPEQKQSYVPVYYIYPEKGNEAAYGEDLNNHQHKLLAMKYAQKYKTHTASAPLTLIQASLSSPAIVIFSPVFNQNKLTGYISVVAQFDDFFNQLAKQGAGHVDLFIQDVTNTEPYILFGQPLEIINRHIYSYTVDVFSRQWKVSIGEHQPWVIQAKNWQTWSMLVGGTLGGVLFQLLILMMAAYSNELSHRVVVKTKELRLAKESSEQKNLAKTNFLHNLNEELRIPLKAVKAFSAQYLKTKPDTGNSNVIKNIVQASDNITQILDNVIDLSKIESGEIVIDNTAFDFYGFLNRVENMVKINNKSQQKSIFFLIDKDVPHFINSDELRLQKLLITLSECAKNLFVTDYLRLSVKVHKHHLDSATLFFVFSHHYEETAKDSNAQLKDYIDQDLSLFSTKMAMVKEVCQLLKGDVNLGGLASGGGVLSASLKINITSLDQQQNYQSRFFDQAQGFDSKNITKSEIIT